MLNFGKPLTFFVLLFTRALQHTCAGDCSSCVGQAVATAVQMAVSAALQRWPGFRGLRDWEVSPQSIYYCRWGRYNTKKVLSGPFYQRNGLSRRHRQAWGSTPW
jgi:hypothetical protein